MAARSSTINTRSRKATPHLWPSGTGAFVRRRTIEFAGMVLAGLGAALAIAGLSFRAEDHHANDTFQIGRDVNFQPILRKRQLCQQQYCSTEDYFLHEMRQNPIKSP